MSPISPITSFDQVTPEWLTYVLTESHTLVKGAVEAIHLDKTERILSQNARLTVRYTIGSAGDLPRKLFLKITSTNAEAGAQISSISGTQSSKMQFKQS